MPDRRGDAVLDDLPDHIIVGKILMLLPPKDIGRCRVVRTAWRSATSTPDFMVEHRRRQPSLPIIDGHGRPASLVTLRAAGAGASSQQVWPFLSRCRKSCCQIHLLASSGGFLIVSRGSQFYICNPTTRKHARLPFPPPSNYIRIQIHGLYHHKSTREYRVLWSRYREDTLYVLTVGANESRSIHVVMPTLPLPSMEQSSFLKPSPVHHRGNLHWFFSWPDPIPLDIIVFDTEAESFRWMRSPARKNLRCNRLFDMEGTIAFLSMDGTMSLDSTTMNVWVMQDYETETWDFKYRIKVSMIEASRPPDLTSPEEKRKRKQPLDSTVRLFTDMAVLKKHELLVGFNYKHVLRCGTDGKFLGMVTIGKKQYRMWLTSHCLQESIMPIPTGEMQGEEEEFPFYTEHV